MVRAAEFVAGVDGDLAYPCPHGLGLDSVGLALTVGSSLMRLGLQWLLAIDLYGLVYERGESGRPGGWAVLKEHDREIAAQQTFLLAGHPWLLLREVTLQGSLDDHPFTRADGMSLPSAGFARLEKPMPANSKTDVTPVGIP